MKITQAFPGPPPRTLVLGPPGEGHEFASLLKAADDQVADPRARQGGGERSPATRGAESSGPFAFSDTATSELAGPFVLGSDGFVAPEKMRLEADQRAFALNELGLFGPRWASPSPVQITAPASAPTPVSGPAAPLASAAAQGVDPEPSLQVNGAGSRLGAAPEPLAMSASKTAAPANTEIQAPAIITGPVGRPDEQNRTAAAEVKTRDVSRVPTRAPPEPSRPSQVSLLASERDGAFDLVAAASGLKPSEVGQLATTLQLMLAQFGKRLGRLTLNGETLISGLKMWIGADNGHRPR